MAAGALAVAGVAAGSKALSEPGGVRLSTNPEAALAGPEAENPLESESARVSHLVRRAGFGVTPEESARYQSIGLDATIDELLNYETINDDAAVNRASSLAESDAPGSAVRWWLSRILNTNRPLQEKLTFFWHGLLTSQLSVVKDPAAMIAQNELLRAHAKASFPDILKAITADPAMMVYLDISGSSKEAPNENYARELMELFSIGEGNYTENDVREGARAFTGWNVPRRRNDQGRPELLEPVFRPQRFDNESKTFLGQTGNFRPDDIIDIIVQQPASASYITGRLFSFFVYPDPEPKDVQPFVDVYLSSGYSIGTTLEAIFRSDVFYSPRAYRAIVKSPVEYAIGAIKALGVQQLDLAHLAGGARQAGSALQAMGQIPMEPPNVAGWPGGASWLNSATLFARLNFIDALTRGGAINASPPADVVTATQALDYYLPVVLDNNVSDEARQELLDYAGGSDAPLAPEQLRDLVYFILASPQYHLA